MIIFGVVDGRLVSLSEGEGGMGCGCGLVEGELRGAMGIGSCEIEVARWLCAR